MIVTYLVLVEIAKSRFYAAQAASAPSSDHPRATAPASRRPTRCPIHAPRQTTAAKEAGAARGYVEMTGRYCGVHFGLPTAATISASSRGGARPSATA